MKSPAKSLAWLQDGQRTRLMGFASCPDSRAWQRARYGHPCSLEIGSLTCVGHPGIHCVSSSQLLRHAAIPKAVPSDTAADGIPGSSQPEGPVRPWLHMRSRSVREAIRRLLCRGLLYGRDLPNLQPLLCVEG